LDRAKSRAVRGDRAVDPAPGFQADRKIILDIRKIWLKPRSVANSMMAPPPAPAEGDIP